MKRLGQRNSGFTIVELLVVVIVLAILATITTLTYRTAKQNARNTETATEVKRYVETLRLYRAHKGYFPKAATSSVCLGTGYTDQKCWLASVDENAAFMSALSDYESDLPKLQQGKVLTGGIFVPASDHTKLDGVDMNWVAYIVEKSSKCPYGPVATYSSGQLFTSAVPASGQSMSPNGYGEVQCWIALK